MYLYLLSSLLFALHFVHKAGAVPHRGNYGKAAYHPGGTGGVGAVAGHAGPSFMVGFHEGSRTTVKCVDGYINGFDIHFKDSPLHRSRIIAGLRVICSSGELELQYGGKQKDTVVFGTTTNIVKSGSCQTQGGIAGINFRTPLSDTEAEIRVGGLSLLCHKEGSEPGVGARIDENPDVAHEKKVLCTDLLKHQHVDKPEGRYSIDAVDLWVNAKGFAGFDLTSCGKY